MQTLPNLTEGHILINMCEIYFAELSDTLDAEVFASYLSLVSPARQQRLQGMKFDIDKKLTLYAEVLVRTLASKKCNSSPEGFAFTVNPYGKPELAGFLNFHFNISHTRNALAVILDDTPVGIDIERVAQADLKIGARFFTPQEQAYIVQDGKDQHKCFYEIWTRKEAYIKQDGKGLSIPLQSFDVTQNDIWQRTHCQQRNGYVLSVCRVSRILRPIPVIQLSEAELNALVLPESKHSI